MKKNINIKIKILIIAMLFIVIGLCFFGFKIKASFVDNTVLSEYLSNDDLNAIYMEYFLDESSDVYIDSSNITNLKDLEDSADIIVKVSVDGTCTRSIYEESVLSQVIVEEVYKGDISDDCIWVFEPVDCYSEDEMSLSDGYNLMQNDHSYILFLNSQKSGEFVSSGTVYTMSTLIFSKYDCIEDSAILFDEDISIESQKYSSIKGNEVVLFDEYTYDKFYSLKEQVMSVYQNE